MIAVLWLGVALAGGDAQEQFAAGVGSLRAGDAPTAELAFREALSSGARDPAVYHGLGNALFRQDEVGAALAAWRRGQRLAPANGDLGANIEHARAGLEDRLEPPAADHGPFFWLSWIAPGRAVQLGALSAGLALFLGALGTRRRRRGGRSRPGMVVGLGMVGVVLAASGWRGASDASVVVVDARVAARSALGGEGVTLFELHEGAELRALEVDRDHVLVSLPDDRKGWVPADAVVSTDPAASFPQTSASAQ